MNDDLPARSSCANSPYGARSVHGAIMTRVRFPRSSKPNSFAVEKLITARKLLDTGSRGGERVGDKRSIAV
jgi:hypothetical protein